MCVITMLGTFDVKREMQLAWQYHGYSNTYAHIYRDAHVITHKGTCTCTSIVVGI